MSQSVLYAQRLKLANPEDHIILPEVISKEPHGPAVLKGDEEWFNLVQWTHFVMLNAEEIGINSVNIDDIRSANNPAYLALIGPESTLGAAFGASNDWAYNIIKQVGNYGEVFERNLGSQSSLMISRGLNRLWINGGLQYAPPIRE